MSYLRCAATRLPALRPRFHPPAVCESWQSWMARQLRWQVERQRPWAGRGGPPALVCIHTASIIRDCARGSMCANLSMVGHRQFQMVKRTLSGGHPVRKRRLRTGHSVLHCTAATLVLPRYPPDDRTVRDGTTARAIVTNFHALPHRLVAAYGGHEETFALQCKRSPAAPFRSLPPPRQLLSSTWSTRGSPRRGRTHR